MPKILISDKMSPLAAEIFTARGLEFGASSRNRASAALFIRALSVLILRL